MFLPTGIYDKFIPTLENSRVSDTRGAKCFVLHGKYQWRRSWPRDTCPTLVCTRGSPLALHGYCIPPVPKSRSTCHTRIHTGGVAPDWADTRSHGYSHSSYQYPPNTGLCPECPSSNQATKNIPYRTASWCLSMHRMCPRQLHQRLSYPVEYWPTVWRPPRRYSVP